jgi:hypothetical protein
MEEVKMLIAYSSLSELKERELHEAISESEIGSHRRHISRKHILEEIAERELDTGRREDRGSDRRFEKRSDRDSDFRQDDRKDRRIERKEIRDELGDAAATV